MGSLNLLTCGGGEGRGPIGSCRKPVCFPAFFHLSMQPAAPANRNLYHAAIYGKQFALVSADQGLQACQPLKGAATKAGPFVCSLPPLYVVILMRAIRRRPSYSLVLPRGSGEEKKKTKATRDRHTYSLAQPTRRGARGESGHAAGER